MDKIKGNFCITDGTLFLELEADHHDIENHPDYLTVPFKTWKGSEPIALLFFTNFNTFRSVAKTDKQKKTYMLTNIYPAKFNRDSHSQKTLTPSELSVLKKPSLLSKNSFSEVPEEFQPALSEDLKSFLHLLAE